MKLSDRHRAALEEVTWRKSSKGLTTFACAKQQLAGLYDEMICNGIDSLKAWVTMTQGQYIMSNRDNIYRYVQGT